MFRFPSEAIPPYTEMDTFSCFKQLYGLNVLKCLGFQEEAIPPYTEMDTFSCFKRALEATVSINVFSKKISSGFLLD